MTNPTPNNQFAWSKRPYGRLFNNLTIVNTAQGRREIAEIFGADLMATAAASGARTAIFDSRNQWYALHDSSVCLKHPGLGARDLVAEIMAAGEKLGIEYIPYIPVDCDRRAWDEHPDWRNVDFDGNVTDQVFPRVCENSPFAEYIASYLVDLLQRYPIQGLWFDGLGVFASCYCGYCRDGFREATGREAPESHAADAEGWKLWLEYKHAATQRVFDTYLAAARSVRPGIPIHTAWESGARGSAQSWIEAYWKWPTPYLQMMRNDTGDVAEFYIPASQYAPSYPISLTEAELRDRAMIAVSNGTIPTFTLCATPAALKSVNADVEARAPWLTDSEPVPYVAVAMSETSRRLCERDQFKDGPDFTLYGTVMPLLEEKIAETCLTEDGLESDDLSKYAVIVLPDTCIITDHVADKLRAFVEAGGGLVATNRASLHTADGAQRPDFALADLLGVHYVEPMPDETVLTPWYASHDGVEQPSKTRCKFLNANSHPIVNDQLIRDTLSTEVVPAFRRGTPSSFSLPYPGQALRVEADPGVDVALYEASQQPGTAWPFLTTRQYGKGRVVYIAANIGFQYASHWSYPFVRRLQTNAVRWAAGANEQPVQIESLLQVHATLFRQPEQGRLIVHLLNSPAPQGYPPMTRQTWGGYKAATEPWNTDPAVLRDVYMTSFGRMREELAPVHDVKVRLRGEFKRVTQEPTGIELTTTVANGWTEVTVPKLDVHCMVVAE
ncbi:MAG TPA: beta-galactosidase trimerization domain-containing protein [Capsulimonadaceae bacterium]|jgi:hypothetical protein